MTSDLSQSRERDMVAPQPNSSPRRGSRFSLGLDRFSGLYALGVLIVVYSIWLPETFPTTQTLRGVSGDQSVTAIVALALVVPLAAGTFDLSVAATVGFVVTEVAWLQAHGHSPLLSVIAALVTGLLIGAANGFVVVRLRVNSFIATLGMSSVLGAGAYWVTGGQWIFTGISEGFLKAGRETPLGVPASVWYLIAIALVLWYMLNYTPLGRHFYATGANPTAARLAGVRVDRRVFQSLVIAGGLSALAGIILMAKLGVASPDVGPPYLLPAFSAAFLGSTQIQAGRVNVAGTLVATYLLAVGVKGLQLGGAPTFVADLFNGVALIVAVALASRTRRTSDG